MRILIACDGSDIGESAAAAVSGWGVECTRDVHLLTVIDPGDLHGVRESEHASSLFIGPATAQGRVVPSPGRGTEIPAQGGAMAAEFTADSPSNYAQAEDKGQAMERARSEHFDYLRAVAGYYFPGRDVSVEVEFSDDPADTISGHAGTIGANVIAVGSHGRSGISRAIMGSIAEKLVRRSEVPVLVVGPAAREALPAAPAAL